MNRDYLKGGRITFHASGAVHLGDKRLAGTCLRTLDRQVFLCNLLFQHPSTFAPIHAIRKRDICLPYPLDEAKPLFAAVYVAPLSEERLVLRSDMCRQGTVVLHCTGLVGTPPLALQIVLGHGVSGPWPPFAVALVPEAVEPESAAPPG